MGSSPAPCQSTSQRNVVATKIFTAKWTPSESPLNGFLISIPPSSRRPRSREKAPICREPHPGWRMGASLMGIGRIALEPVDRPGLGRAQGDPVLRDILESDEELLGAFQGHGVELVPAFGLDLKGKFTHELSLVAARSPHAN